VREFSLSGNLEGPRQKWEYGYRDSKAQAVMVKKKRQLIYIVAGTGAAVQIGNSDVNGLKGRAI
jgi:hypothetical protein